MNQEATRPKGAGISVIAHDSPWGNAVEDHKIQAHLFMPTSEKRAAS